MSKFSLGDIVRYGEGCTALMRIDHISPKHGGDVDRFYGQQCMGGVCGAYEDRCRPATQEDIETWHSVAREYKLNRDPPNYKLSQRGLVGAVEGGD